jgi:inosine-uridine nucleoside N-ribohydrolase
MVTRHWPVGAGSVAVLLVLLAWSPATAASPEPPDAAPIPVIFDTDIGDDIDDTWALVMLLRSPALDVRLITTDYGNTVYRARLVARLLEVAGRTDIPIGIGIQENENEGAQAEWVEGYDLDRYPGVVHEDGVQALIDAAMAAPEPLTLIAVGPPPSLAAALEREPRIAGRLRLAGMFGSIRRGYGDAPEPSAEWNVRANVDAARTLLAAPWVDAILTPLDTCGLVQLKGDRYARVRDSTDPLVQALMENYRIWCPLNEWCRDDPDQVKAKSSTLFDTVAVYLAQDRSLVKTETLGVRVTDDGKTVPDETAPALDWATGWKSLDRFEELLTERLLSPAR